MGVTHLLARTPVQARSQPCPPQRSAGHAQVPAPRSAGPGERPCAPRSAPAPQQQPARASQPWRRRPSRAAWLSTARQSVLVVAGVAVYFLARGLTEASPARAQVNADEIIALERSLRLHVEPAAQALVADSDALMTFLNWIYIWGHWPVIAVTFLWLSLRSREHFLLLRNAMVASGVIGVVIFTLYPVAPPRLAGLGLMDSVSENSAAYRILQPPAFVNQYAAVPSLHVGWDLLVGIVVFLASRHVVLRVLAVAMPIAMTAAVVLTANHYVVDAVFGAVVALVGLKIAALLAERRRSKAAAPAGVATASCSA